MVRCLAAALTVALMGIPALPAFAVAEDGVAFSQETFTPGATAAIFVRDAGLNLAGSCTAAWVGATAVVSQAQWWSLAGGTPAAADFSLSPGCAFDQATPADTPLVMPPSGQLPWVAQVDGIPNLVDDFKPQTGELSLLNDVNSGGVVLVDFYFDVVDEYAASDLRARVFSTSDQAGEWLTLGEVAGEEDSSPSPSTGLFKGEVRLSGDNGSAGAGDGAVWAEVGDTLTAVYYEADGSTVIASHQARVVQAPTPTPTPVASAGWVGLLLLAVLLAGVVLWRLGAARSLKAPG